MLQQIPILSILIWLPILGAVVVAGLRKPGQENVARLVAIFISCISLGLCGLLYIGFDLTTSTMQFAEYSTWIPALKLHYSLGIDGISFPLLVLTCFTTLLVVMASWTMVKVKVPQYLAAFLVTQGAIVGVFCALDAMLFYFFL